MSEETLQAPAPGLCEHLFVGTYIFLKAMRTITEETYLAADPDIVKRHLMTPALLNYVVAGFMKFRPVEPAALPDRWTPGEYKVLMLAFHVLPVGWQIVRIEKPDENDEWFLRDNGLGSIARSWDHRIFVAPEGEGTRYVDEVRIDAGILTWPVALYAALFYRYRQRRWRKLVGLNFAPLHTFESDN
jgi:hypothetical protein